MSAAEAEDAVTQRDPSPEPTRKERRERAIRRAKRKVRTDIRTDEWSKQGYYWSQMQSTTGLVDNIPREHCDTLSPDDFVSKYDRPHLPVIVQGLTRDWAANQRWVPQQFLQQMGGAKIKVGSDDDGYPVRLKMRHFFKYCRDHYDDDSPLYVFESRFAERKASRHMAQDFEVPAIFSEDLFGLCGASMRPPYRWFVMGPPRSGSNVHIDPLATSAWNALVHGRKRWAIFPPEVPKSELQPPGFKNLEAIEWFDKVLPRLRAKYGTGPDAVLLEGVQQPGETIFVPPNWWHAVLNLDFTVAVTQNFTSSANFVESWIKTQKGRPKLSRRWYERLAELRPELAELADANRLPYDPVERKREKKRQRAIERERKAERKRLRKEARDKQA